MSTRTLLIFIGIVCGLLFFTLFFFFWDTAEVNSPVPVNPPSGAPSTNLRPNEAGFIELDSRDGSKVQVNNFIQNNETIPDSSNAGNFILAGSLGYCLPDGSCPSGAQVDTFSVSFSDVHQFFSISLLKEPLGSARRDAESFLMNRLGIGEEDMCKLPFVMGVPFFVNETYAGQELGFSFCPGAVQLPE